MECLEVGKASLYASDVIDFLSRVEGSPFDLTITSPPYGLDKAYEGVSDRWAWEDYLAWVGRWGGLLLGATSEGGRLCLNVPVDTNLGGHRAFAAEMTLTMQSVGWRYETTIPWDKLGGRRNTAFGSWMRASAPAVVIPYEVVLVFSKGDWKRPERGRASTITAEEFLEWRSTPWRFPGESSKKRKHPAPFPAELPRRLIRLFSFTDDLIFDPFVGSGTTCEQAEAQGRASVGVDQHLGYLQELALPRIRQAADVRDGVVVDARQDRWETLPLVAALSPA